MSAASTFKSVFIGAGNMGKILIKSALERRVYRSEEILVFEKDPETARQIKSEFNVEVLEGLERFSESVQTVYMCVKPDAVKDVSTLLKNRVSKTSVIISIAAGVSLDLLKTYYPEGTKLIRVMPNTPAAVGKGTTAYSCGDFVKESDKKMVTDLFSCIGSVFEVPESKMNIVTALSGSGPAYVFLFIQSLIDAAVTLGLDVKTARNLAVKTVEGSAFYTDQSGEHPAVLIDKVKSPGGTTAAGLGALEKNHFRYAVSEALREAVKKAEELGKG